MDADGRRRRAGVEQPVTEIGVRLRATERLGGLLEAPEDLRRARVGADNAARDHQRGGRADIGAAIEVPKIPPG